MLINTLRFLTIKIEFTNSMFFKDISKIFSFLTAIYELAEFPMLKLEKMDVYHQIWHHKQFVGLSFLSVTHINQSIQIKSMV